jgi:hypothetical protein
MPYSNQPSTILFQPQYQFSFPQSNWSYDERLGRFEKDFVAFLAPKFFMWSQIELRSDSI